MPKKPHKGAKAVKFDKKHPVTSDGFSEWVYPVMRGYLMACCDCGLVHEVQFKAIRQTGAEGANGMWPYEDVPKGRVALRARRAKRHTARLRTADKTLSRVERKPIK